MLHPLMAASLAAVVSGSPLPDSGSAALVRPPDSTASVAAAGALLHDDERVYVPEGDGVTALDARTGKVVWHSAGPSERMRLSDDLLLATECGTSRTIATRGRWMTGRSTANGREVFAVRLPTEFNDPLSIREVAGLFVVQDSRRTSGDRALLIDREGHVRIRLSKYLVHGVRVGEDFVLLTDQEVVRRTPSGEVRWSIPSIFGSGDVTSGGGIVEIPGGDLLECEFNRISDSGVSVRRLDPSSGKLRWSVFCQPLGVDHSMYSHSATVVSDSSQLKVTSAGSYGTFTEWLDPESGKLIRRVTSP